MPESTGESRRHRGRPELCSRGHGRAGRAGVDGGSLEGFRGGL